MAQRQIIKQEEQKMIQAKSEISKLEIKVRKLLDEQFSEYNFVPVEAGGKQYVFAGISGKRKWRFDFAAVDLKVAIEAEGGQWGPLVRCHNCGTIVKKRYGTKWVPVRAAGGSHVRGQRFESDIEKYTEAAIEGWVVLRVTSSMLRNIEQREWFLARLEKILRRRLLKLQLEGYLV